MKNLIKLILVGATLSGSIVAKAQIDLRTGIDANGNLQSVMADDARWSVKTPLDNNYRAIKIGTGICFDPNITNVYQGGYPYEADFSEINSNARWLTAFPWTAQQLGGWTPPAGSNLVVQPGDMKYNATPGTYIYRLTFNMQWPTCKRPNWASILVSNLAGIGEVKQISFNGMASVNAGNYAVSYVSGVSSLSANQLRPYAAYSANVPGANSLSSICPPYYIPVPANALLNGTNYMYVFVDNPNPDAVMGAGLVCDAQLFYSYGADVITTPSYTANVTSAALCAGATPTLNLYMTNLPITGATVNITASPAVAGFPYTGTITQYANFQLPLNATAPATYTITLTNNDPTRPCTSVRKVKTYNCNVATFNWNVNTWTGRVFSGSTGSDNPLESSIPGFENKWTLEELDPLTSQPVYSIVDPAIWATEPGQSTSFNAFTVENNYSGEVATLTGSPDNAGTFSADKVYRITRSYRSTASPNWEDYSITLGPGYNELVPPGEEALVTRRSNGGKFSAATFSVYPNPGKELFQINLNGVTLESDIEVMNALGARVLTLKRVAGEQIYQLNLSNQPKGIYFLKVNNSLQKLVVE